MRDIRGNADECGCSQKSGTACRRGLAWSGGSQGRDPRPQRRGTGRAHEAKFEIEEPRGGGANNFWIHTLRLRVRSRRCVPAHPPDLIRTDELQTSLAGQNQSSPARRGVLYRTPLISSCCTRRLRSTLQARSRRRVRVRARTPHHRPHRWETPHARPQSQSPSHC